MIRYRHDIQRGLFVSCSITHTPADGAQDFMAENLRFVVRSAATQTKLVQILVMDKQAVRLAAADYAQMVEFRNMLFNAPVAKSPPQRLVVAVVSSSVVLRALATALNWLKPPPAHVTVASFASFDDAVVFAERERHETLPELYQYFDAVQGRAALHA